MILCAKSQGAINADADSESLKSRLKEIRDHLRHRKELIDAEIRNYPTPISRCDAQFNHLLEERARLFRELDRLGAIASKRTEPEDVVELIEGFIGSLKSDSQE
jgi:hypothetical protein